MVNILIIHGPNLNLLGTREPEIYGADTLDDINQGLAQKAARDGIGLETFQSNNEGDIVGRIQQAGANKTDMIIINPAAYTHTSIAIRDAFLATRVPFIEVHLSNVYAREAFRKQSHLADIAIGVIGGFGINSYRLALDAAISHCQAGNKSNSQ
jgi:3-dehydroquinate dehydratase II